MHSHISAQPVHICQALYGKSGESVPASHDSRSVRWRFLQQPRQVLPATPLPIHHRHRLSQAQQHPRPAACCPAAAVVDLEARHRPHCGYSDLNYSPTRNLCEHTTKCTVDNFRNNCLMITCSFCTSNRSHTRYKATTQRIWSTITISINMLYMDNWY